MQGALSLTADEVTDLIESASFLIETVRYSIEYNVVYPMKMMIIGCIPSTVS